MIRVKYIKVATGLLVACSVCAFLLISDASIESNEVKTSSLTGNPLKGRNVFVTKGCIKCHAAWGVGGKIAPDLARIGMGKSLLQIAGELWNHSPKMISAMEQHGVPRPTLTAEEVGDFISYLYYLNYYNEAGSVANGRKLFSEKGCIDCHSIGGSGGRTGPALDDHRRYASALSSAQAMWNHGPQMAVIMRTGGVEKPSLRGREAVDLLAFIRGRTPGDLPNDKFMLPGSPAAGQQLFTTKGCATCHSIDGRTRSTAPGLSKTSRYRSVTEIAGAMWNHGPEIWARMQRAGVARPIFSGNEMADIVSFLYFLRYTDAPGDPVAGKRLFSTKGCVQCHSSDLDLSKSAALASPISLMAAMWNHAPKMEKQVQRRGIAWPTFQGDELRELIEYVRASSRQVREKRH